MSFVDTLWGFEVTGGYDQYEPLTVLNVSLLFEFEIKFFLAPHT